MVELQSNANHAVSSINAREGVVVMFGPSCVALCFYEAPAPFMESLQKKFNRLEDNWECLDILQVTKHSTQQHNSKRFVIFFFYFCKVMTNCLRWSKTNVEVILKRIKMAGNGHLVSSLKIWDYVNFQASYFSRTAELQKTFISY